MEPIAYSMNNVFITDWNEKDYTRLDFGDIFKRFYKEAYGINCPYVMNDNLSVKNEYRIPADEFENVIAQHIGISREELHKLTLYDADSDSYLYRPRGYGEYDYAEVPYPEVVSYKKNDDGSVVLFVNAVYPHENTSKLFSHKVTILEEDGRTYYLSNEIVGGEEPDLWWHADRCTDESE